MNIAGVSKFIQWLACLLITSAIYAMNIIPSVFMLLVGSSSVRAVFVYLDFQILTALLCIYQVNTIMACFLISSFFNRSISASYTGLVYYMSTILLLFICNMFYQQIPFICRLLLSSFGNIGVGLALRSAIVHDIKRQVINWNNVIFPAYQDQPYSIGYAMLMMLAGTFVMGVIFFYIEFIYKGTLCQKTILAPSFYSRKTSRLSAIDLEGVKKKSGIKLQGLKKAGNANHTKIAIDDVSFSVYISEITAMIGNQDSGKDEILSMVIGVTHPEEGAVFINSINAADDKLARRSLGYLPQRNIIFGNLSVAQNITFFSRMRGTQKKYINLEIRKYCKLLNMDGETKAKNLPMAKRRKLSVALAFCGGTSVVVLDEPSFDTDPLTKREIWTMIHKEKENRSILISTNYMDEADALGERIAIMFEGKLACYGTIFFLKKKYGNGYILVCIFFLTECNLIF